MVIPRLYFEDTVILKRKTWEIPPAKLPVINAVDDEWDRFLKVKAWQAELSLPDEVFIAVSESDNEEENIKNKLGDDRKPQYIHFNNPLLTNLLLKVFSKVSTRLLVHEFLPGGENMMTINGNKYVSELLVQWRN